MFVILYYIVLYTVSTFIFQLQPLHEPTNIPKRVRDSPELCVLCSAGLCWSLAAPSVSPSVQRSARHALPCGAGEWAHGKRREPPADGGASPSSDLTSVLSKTHLSGRKESDAGPPEQTSLMKHHQTCDSVRIIFLIITSTPVFHTSGKRHTERPERHVSESSCVWILSICKTRRTWASERHADGRRSWGTRSDLIVEIQQILVVEFHTNVLQTLKQKKRDKSISSIMSWTITFPVWAHVNPSWNFHDHIHKISAIHPAEENWYGERKTHKYEPIR